MRRLYAAAHRDWVYAGRCSARHPTSRGGDLTPAGARAAVVGRLQPLDGPEHLHHATLQRGASKRAAPYQDESQHDDDLYVLLPYQPPKGCRGVRPMHVRVHGC